MNGPETRGLKAPNVPSAAYSFKSPMTRPASASKASSARLRMGNQLVSGSCEAQIDAEYADRPLENSRGRARSRWNNRREWSRRQERWTASTDCATRWMTASG